MKIMLHICCGPCSTYVIKTLRKKGHIVSGLFFNPNIYPKSEYAKRLAVVRKFADEEQIPLLEARYSYEVYKKSLKGETKRPGRCRACFELRLEEAVRMAKSHQFEAFTTTLLVSKYQNVDLIRDLAYKLSQKYRIFFWDEAFHKGYRKSRGIAGQRRMYQQKYRGCEFSLKEKDDEIYHS